MQSLTTKVIYNLHRTARQARFHKPTHYPAIPFYVKPNFIDIHDTYTKRSMQEIKQELADKEFDIEYQRLVCDPGDYHKNLKQQRATAIIDIEQFNFTELQLERFKVLVGQRYKPGKTTVKFSCHVYPSYQANFEKINEQIYEVLMEAKRAP